MEVWGGGGGGALQVTHVVLWFLIDSDQQFFVIMVLYSVFLKDPVFRFMPGVEKNEKKRKKGEGSGVQYQCY